MEIVTIVGGPIDTNAYLLADPESGDAFAIDAPKDTAAAIAAVARERGVTITRIINTHGHWDHIADNAALQRLTAAPILVHRLDADRLRRPSSTMMQLPFSIPPVEPDHLLEDGEELALGRYRFIVLHTPGHCPGSVCLYEPGEGVLIAGDTLFPNGHGNTQLPGANQADMDRSLARLAALPPKVRVYPGHGAPTTIGAEQGWLSRYAARA
jgi:glyoxylase-like metal-dependent hydrolase (beta-lactamase superfamily II)